MRLEATILAGAIVAAAAWWPRGAISPAAAAMPAPSAPGDAGASISGPSDPCAADSGVVIAAVDASGPGCAAWDATYVLTGTLRITDTPMGAGDGVHAVGPGTMIIHFDEGAGATPARVELRAFELAQRFSLEPSSFVMSATIATRAVARATADASGSMAAGTVSGDAIRWDTPLRGYHTDGTIECTGSLCGNFGAPPAGRSDLHSAPRPVQLAPFRFKSSGLTFQMPFALVSQQKSPSQRGFLALAGRAKSWVCVRPSP